MKKDKKKRTIYYKSMTISGREAVVLRHIYEATLEGNFVSSKEDEIVFDSLKKDGIIDSDGDNFYLTRDGLSLAREYFMDSRFSDEEKSITDFWEKCNV